MPRTLRVTALNIYPVKSLAGVPMESVNVRFRGFENDRRYAMVGEDGKVYTQRDQAKFAAVKASVTADGVSLVSISGSIFLPTPSGKLPRRSIYIWYNEAEAGDCGDAISDWLSAIAEEPVRLLYFDPATERKSNRHAPEDDVSFADQYPVMAATEATLADLNAKLASIVPMNRFRPNIVITGAEALEEDNWSSVQIGDLHFRAVANCKRCEVTTIDQERGERTGSEPLRTLASYRTIDRGAVFGRFLVPEEEGTIRVGDSVIVG